MKDDDKQIIQSHGEQIDFIAKKVLEHDDEFTNIKDDMATKSDIREIMNTLDVLVKLGKKKDEELTFVGNRMNRIEKGIEKNTNDIQKMKPALGLN